MLEIDPNPENSNLNFADFAGLAEQLILGHRRIISTFRPPRAKMSSRAAITILRHICTLLLYAAYDIAPTGAFTTPSAAATATACCSRRTAVLPSSSLLLSSDSPPGDAADADTTNISGPQQPNAVRAPLKYIGPYPCLALRFPYLATSSQRGRNITGISLDFVLDTAANTNTLNGQVAKELQLEVVGEALPGLGAGGSIAGGDTYLLGDCQLDYGVTMTEGSAAEADDERDMDDNGTAADVGEFIFMRGLTASALPVASPAAAGLLGMYFFNCFQGGVMLEWGSNSNSAIPSTAIPSVTFFSDRTKMGDALDGLARAQIKPLPVSALPSINIVINGQKIPALLDTGSPITVLNAQAAKMAGVTTATVDDSENSSNPFNPFAKLTKNFQSAQAAARGDVLLIAGANGERVELVKSKEVVDCGVVGDGDGTIDIGQHNIYVGDLPGLAALGGLGGDGAPPAAVLGMDILRTRQRIVYRVDEVYL